MLENIKQQEIILDILRKTDDLCSTKGLDNEQIAFFRDDIRKKIFFLQEELLEKYSETVMKFIIFPIITYVDEKIMFKYKDNNSDFNWSLLQLEYYSKNDGGEYVFEIIENLLSDAIYPKICYEVIYFILEGGFLGKYYERTFDHNYIAYKKKITKLIDNDNNDYGDLIFSDVTRVNKNNKIIRKYRSNALKFFIPLILLGISVLIFIY